MVLVPAKDMLVKARKEGYVQIANIFEETT